ncbi:MAG: aldolase/citrate lyase family protein, partial [Propionibacteriaceae bacterium]
MTTPIDTAASVTSPLNRGRLRSSLAAGKPTVGTFVGAASPVTAEVCAAAGVDWVLLDLEHGAGGEEQVGPVVVAAMSRRMLRCSNPSRLGRCDTTAARDDCSD